MDNHARSCSNRFAVNVDLDAFLDRCPGVWPERIGALAQCNGKEPLESFVNEGVCEAFEGVSHYFAYTGFSWNFSFC